MAVYQYTAREKDGTEFSGTYEDVGSVAVLREELAKLDCVLVKAQKGKKSSGRGKRIKPTEVVTFAYKFAGMYSAGLSITDCLKTIEDQADSQAFRNIITDIRQSVEAGSSLTEAFEKHRDVFSDFFLGMVEAGESSGKLAQTLEMSTAYLEKRVDLSHKLKAAFSYPIIVGVMSAMMVIGMMIFVVPVFSKIYRQLHVTLPTPTRILVNLSLATRNYWWVGILAITGFAMLFKQLSKNIYLRAKWDAFKLEMPVFGKLNRMVVVSHFVRTFALLISVGVPLIDAFEIANKVAHNHKMTEFCRGLQESVKAGIPVAKSMQNYEIFPPIITQLAASGEEAGVLADMLNKGVDFLDKDIERTIKNLLIKLEPALLVIMGTSVGLLLLGVYLPIFDYMSHLE